jgi:NAD(P)-dependent dehydrogenase (short-subunit alcohol dehydrogenase family)
VKSDADSGRFAPLLEKAGTRQDPSRIIIVSSTAGTTVPHVGEHGTIMYSVSKAAAHHLSRQLAVELGPRNITTNTVAPGFFPSKLANGLIELLGGQQELEDGNPRRRLGEPEDIAGVMVYLASPAGAYVNGEDIAVDGGVRYTAGRQSKL